MDRTTKLQYSLRSNLYIDSLTQLADSYDLLTEHQVEAVYLREQALEACIEVAESTSDKILFAKQRLARSCHISGQEDRALKLRRELFEITKGWSDRPDMRLEAVGELSKSLHAKGFWQQAMEHRIQHAREATEVFGEAHHDTPAAQLNLAASFTLIDRKEDTQQLRNAVFKVRCDTLKFEKDLSHPMTLHAYSLVARSVRDNGDQDRAYKMFNHTLQQWEKYPLDIRNNYQEDYLSLKRILAVLLERKVSYWQHIDWEYAEDFYNLAMSYRQKIVQAQETAFGNASRERLLASDQATRPLVAIGNLHQAWKHTTGIAQEYKDLNSKSETWAWDEGYLVIVRHVADICERLVEHYRPVSSREKAGSTRSENILPTASASSSSVGLQSSHESQTSATVEVTANGGSETSEHISGIAELDDPLIWQERALSYRREIVRHQCCGVATDSQLNQSALKDLIKLGAVLERVNREESLQCYQRALLIMQQPERLSRLHPQTVEVREMIQRASLPSIIGWFEVVETDPEARSISTEPSKDSKLVAIGQDD